MTSPSEADHARPRAWLPVTVGEWRPAAEVLGLLGAFVAVEWLLFRSVGAPRVHPHPYWAVIFFAALRHGRRAGLLVATLCSALYASGLERAAPGEAVGLVSEPFLFLAVAFLVGGLRDDVRRRLGSATAAATAARDELAERDRRDGAAAGRDAETYIEAAWASPPSLTWIGTPLDLGLRLRREFCRGARYGSALGIIAVHFHLWSDDSADGWDRLDRYVLRTFRSAIRVSDSVYRFGFPGCFVVVLPGTSQADTAIVIARLADRAAHAPVETIGPVRLNALSPGPDMPDVESLLVGLTEQFRSSSINPVDRRSAAVAPRGAPVQGLDEFRRTLQCEINLAGREGTSLTVVGLFAIAASDARPDLLALHVEQILPRVMRPVDGAYAIGPQHVALVLPRTEQGDAAKIAQRVVAMLALRHPRPRYGPIAQQVLAFDPDHADPHGFLADLARAAPVRAVELVDAA